MKQRILILIMVLFSAQIYAQSVEFVNISSDPTYYSLGGANLTADANAFSVTGNASAMALGEQKMAVGAGYGIWQPKGINDGMVSISGYGLIIGKFAVGLNGKYMLHKPYDIISGNGTIRDEKFTPTDMSIDLGVAYRIINGLSVGVNVRYISSKLYDEASGSAIAADVSVSYRLKGLRLAVAATNLGSKINYGYSPYNLPAMAKLGIGYSYDINPKNVISVHAEGDYLLYKKGLMAGIGAEYAYNDMISARVGYHYGDKNSIPSFASAGIGVKVIGITLNAAYVLGFSNSPVNGSMMFSLGYEF